MKFIHSTASEVGPRSTNEDSVGVWQNSDNYLAVAVADGLGGYRGGQYASSMAIRMFGEAIDKPESLNLQQLAWNIHNEIRDKQSANQDIRGMATTLTGAIFSNGLLQFVHCGDTRITLQRNNGIRRMTVDHTEAQRLLDTGLLSRKEYLSYPRKNVLESALGVSDTPRIDTGEFEIFTGDRIFFTTDGVHSKVYLREIRDVSVNSTEPSVAVEKIVELVSQKGADDNFTISAIFVE
jgi:PPM family protein phosphatase